MVESTLGTWRCDAALDVAVLLVSELVANAVLHARTTIGVVIRLDGELLRIAVHDEEQRAPARKHYSAMATTGRGLMLVEQLARDWGVDGDRDGKSVWFELYAFRATPPGPSPFAFAMDFDDELEMEPMTGRSARATPPPPAQAHRPADRRLLLLGVRR